MTNTKNNKTVIETLLSQSIKPEDYLNQSDIEYAKRHGLTLEEMVDFKADMEREDQLEWEWRQHCAQRDAFPVVD